MRKKDISLAARTESFIREKKLLTPGARVVVACSGGPDSLALLDMMTVLRESWGLDIIAAHLEHGIRGEASLGDARFVEEFCAQRGVECRIAHEDVPRYAKKEHLSIETAARERRYAFLREVAGRAPVATAHHADDQAETVMMHIIRGSGITGLGAMRPKSGGVIRPLLFASRREIEDYCEARGLLPRIDETNAEKDATRNRVRLELMPVLRSFNPAIRDALCRLAEAAADSSDFLEEVADSAYGDIIRQDSDEVVMNAEKFSRLPSALQYRVMELLTDELKIRRRVTYEHYLAIVRFANRPGTGGTLSLPGNVTAKRGYGEIHFTRFKKPDGLPGAKNLSAGCGNHRDFLPTPLVVPGVTRIGRAGFSVKAWYASGLPDDLGANVVALDAGKITLPILVRPRRAGDSFQISEGRRQKVKSLMIDRKIPREARDCVPIFEAGGEIFWIGGLRRADCAMVDEATKKILCLELRRG